MEQLVKRVSEKAGITAGQARAAVDEVAATLKAGLPHYFHAQIDHLLAGGTLGDGLKKKLHALQDDFEEAARNFGQRAGGMADDVKKKMDDLFKK